MSIEKHDNPKNTWNNFYQNQAMIFWGFFIPQVKVALLGIMPENLKIQKQKNISSVPISYPQAFNQIIGEKGFSGLVDGWRYKALKKGALAGIVGMGIIPLAKENEKNFSKETLEKYPGIQFITAAPIAAMPTTLVGNWLNRLRIYSVTGGKGAVTEMIEKAYEKEGAKGVAKEVFKKGMKLSYCTRVYNIAGYHVIYPQLHKAAKEFKGEELSHREKLFYGFMSGLFLGVGSASFSRVSTEVLKYGSKSANPTEAIKNIVKEVGWAGFLRTPGFFVHVFHAAASGWAYQTGLEASKNSDKGNTFTERRKFELAQQQKNQEGESIVR